MWTLTVTNCRPCTAKCGIHKDGHRATITVPCWWYETVDPHSDSLTVTEWARGFTRGVETECTLQRMIFTLNRVNKSKCEAYIYAPAQRALILLWPNDVNE